MFTLPLGFQLKRYPLQLMLLLIFLKLSPKGLNKNQHVSRLFCFNITNFDNISLLLHFLQQWAKGLVFCFLFDFFSIFPLPHFVFLFWRNQLKQWGLSRTTVLSLEPKFKAWYSQFKARTSLVLLAPPQCCQHMWNTAAAQF